MFNTNSFNEITIIQMVVTSLLTKLIFDTCYVDIYKHAIIRKRTTIRTNYTYLLIYHVHQDYGAF